MDFDFKSCPWGDNLKSCAITVCDLDGVVLYQNKRSVEVNGDVRGRSMIPCHSARSREIIQRLMSEGATNAYTIQDKVYMLMPIEAAKWTMFVAPFDVKSIYVIEAYPEKQLLKDYEEDITKYVEGLDKAKVKAVYNHISTFLAKENKRFQITKIGKNARNRDYIGCVEWLADAGVINVCYCLNQPELPLKGNYVPKLYKIYYKDTGLLIASLDEEAQEDLRANKNLGTYKGAIYENIVGDMLVKQGYNLYYYSSDKPSIEMDFFVRDADSLIPVEVKSNDNATASLNNLLKEDKCPDVKYGIKLGYKNIGFNGKFYTFPYFLTFLLKRFVTERRG